MLTHYTVSSVLSPYIAITLTSSRRVRDHSIYQWLNLIGSQLTKMVGLAGQTLLQQYSNNPDN